MDNISVSEAAKKREIPARIEEIVEKYSTYIYNIAYKLTGKTEQAEDITQETFIKAWKHLDELKEQTALKQWLHTICINGMRNGCFLAMSRKLSVNQRIVFSLIDMFGLSIQEVSDILGITPKAVKGLLYRARMNLDSFFQSHCYFLNTENPCRCKAWVEFFQTRNELQSFMQDKILDYTEKGYEFDLEVRKKIALYYHQIPDQMPEKEWYQMLISQFNHV